MVELLNALWPIFVAVILFIVWLVRLEGRVNGLKREIDLAAKLAEAVAMKHSELERRLIDELNAIKVMLARIEATMEKNDE